MKLNKRTIKAIVGASALIISALLGEQYGEVVSAAGNIIIETQTDDPSITSGFDFSEDPEHLQDSGA